MMTKPTNEFPALLADVAAAVPGAKLVAEHGKWLDIHAGDFLIVVEYRIGQGFGVSRMNQVADPLDGFMEGPDEVFTDRAAAVARVVELVPLPAETADSKD